MDLDLIQEKPDASEAVQSVGSRQSLRLLPLGAATKKFCRSPMSSS